MAQREEQHTRHGPPRVVASAPSVAAQARLMDAAGTAWHAVKCGNLEMITKLFPNRCNVYAKGPVGENVVHVAMLLNTPSTLQIAKYLVSLYGPTLVNCPIQERRTPHDPPGTYEGQTALHIAIANRDADMVKFLVQNGADTRARAWGTFFRQGGPMYYGEFPLSFAACTGQKDVVAYLRRHGAQVNRDCDVFGNTALHLCVIHDQPDMYDFLSEYCAASDAVRNHQGLTPLVLAAQLGKEAMLQHVYSRRRRAFYSFGRVTSYSLSLREIDTVQDYEESPGPDGGYVPNVLEVAVRKRHLGMMQEPLLTTLLQHKWEAFARTQFLVHFAGYLLLEISQTLLIWLISEPGLWNGPARASQEFLGMLLALGLLAVEVADYTNWSRECYHRRLTMTVHREQDPPLYPIPGEMRDARDGRQSLFARLSARMGFAQPSGSTQGAPSGIGAGQSGGSSLLHHRSDGGVRAEPPRPPQAPRGASHPGAAQQQQQQQQQHATAAADGHPNGRPASPFESMGGQRLLLLDPQISGGQQQQQQQQQASRLGAAVAAAPGTPVSPLAASSAPPGAPSVSTRRGPAPVTPPRPAAAGAAAAADGADGTPPAGRGPALASQRRSHGDDPIDLRPSPGGTTISDGRSPMGVAVVDSGFTVPPPAGAGPLGEGREGGAPPPPPAEQHQQGGAPARQPSASREALLRPVSAVSGSSGGADGDDLDDVVSVGLRGRMRSQHALSDSSPLATPAGAAAAVSATPSPGGAAAPDAGGSGSVGRTVSFAVDGGGGVAMVRALSQRSLSGRSLHESSASEARGSPRYSGGSPSAQWPLSPLSPGQPTPLLLGHASSSGAAFGGDEAGPVPGGSSLLATPTPVAPATAQQQQRGPHAGGDAAVVAAVAAAADGAGTPVAPGSPAGGTPLLAESRRPSFRVGGGMPRAWSFHGASAAAAAGGGASALAASGRAATVGDDLVLLQTMGATPSGPQMLERQRTRVRSGGGDLPTALTLKRTPASKLAAQGSAGGPGGAPGQPAPDVPEAAHLGAPGRSSNAAVAAAAAAAAAGAGGALAGAGGGGGGSGGAGAGGGGGNAGEGSMRSDPEKGAPSGLFDPHKTRLRAVLETTYEGAVRMVEDPWLFVWHLHLLLTLLHFVIWVSSYGWIGGEGPKSLQVRELDDVIVSMMGLSGWLAVIYFFRGIEATGKLAVVLERCLVDVLKFVSLYVLWNLGFTLAFYTMQNGVLAVAPDHIDRNTPGLLELSTSEPDPFATIGNTMITLINLGTGLSHYEYGMTCKNDYVLSTALCSIYYLLYMATVVLLLMNLLTAMIISTWQSTQGAAEAHWKHRWAIYVLKAERRLPAAWVRRLRLGQLAWDPKTQKDTYSHVFETVEDERGGGDGPSRSAVDGQIKAVEALLDELKKRRGGGAA